MSDWLSIIIIILIVGIILDGLRRARNKRKNGIVLSKSARKYDLMFKREDEMALKEDADNGASNSEQGDRPDSEVPEQKSLNLDEPVPMLMETCEAPSDLSHVDELQQDEHADMAPEDMSSEHSGSRVYQDKGRDINRKIRQNVHLEPTLGDLDDVDEVIDEHGALATGEREPEAERSELEETNSAGDSSTHSAQKIEPEELLVINVIGKANVSIPGGELLDALSSVELKYGDMQIFHRHLNNDGDAPSIYSVAKIVEPGSFDLVEKDANNTPGVCLFLQLPCAGNAIEAYEDMVSTARLIGTRLDCDLVDENRSALTNQTIEHGRQRVMEFERKTKLKQHTHR